MTNLGAVYVIQNTERSSCADQLIGIYLPTLSSSELVFVLELLVSEKQVDVHRPLMGEKLAKNKIVTYQVIVHSRVIPLAAVQADSIQWQ